MFLLSINFIFATIILVKTEEPSKLVYKQCNETISQREFIIESVGYPQKYPENFKCEYFLKSHFMCHTEFHFQFLDFDLENSSNCSKDRLEVNDDNLCGILTGYRMYKTKNSSYLKLKFVSDSTVSKKGFKILITRLPCEGNNHLNATIKNSPKSVNLPKCCADFYNSRRFYLSSPGFPNSKGSSDCYYHIYRANPNICRLRIHFKFFSLGFQRGGQCENGFLEIDDKKICGCQTELDLISQFDQFWGNTPKVIRYKNMGYFNDNFNGFAIEVIQDECPVRYSPTLESRNTFQEEKGEKIPEFYFYNDQLNRITYPNTNTTNKEKENLELDYNNRIPKVLIDYYFFKAPENDEALPELKEKEPRTYVDTSDDFFLTNDQYKCQSWGLQQWNYLSNEILWKKMPKCRIIQSGTMEPKCYDIRQYRGMLNNPGYPFYYFANLNCCYRFHKIDGYCGIQFYVNDFDLELSPECQKDSFVLYNQYRYCGNSLIHSQFSFDLTQRQSEDIKFSTDNYFCGRGFSLYYEHIPCVYPTTPHVPPITTPRTTPTPPIRPSCGGDITTEFFDINISNAHEECTYYIISRNEDICGIKLDFLNFNLVCGIEYLIINNKQYCGNINGQSIKVDFDQNKRLLIQYRRRTDRTPALSNIFIRGQQLKNCLEVPAQRILQRKSN